ncbi:MAG TPA: glycosyltransferase, partial [Methanocella sp.]|nr:glycosyltransferase [Methanocella sp.]
GLIITAADEDFGMTAVEAMASGKPVITVAEGGYLETMMDGVTGKLIEFSPNAIVHAVKDAGSGWKWSQVECEMRARTYDTSRFVGEVRKALEPTIG